jgi:hypothetical protein
MVLLSINIIEKLNKYIRIILFPVNRPVFPVNGWFYPVNEMTKIGNSLRIKEWVGLLTCGFGIVFGYEKEWKLKYCFEQTVKKFSLGIWSFLNAVYE